LAFVEHARRLGHECGPLDWTSEVAHRYRGGSGRFTDTHLIADALLHYTVIDPVAQHRDHLQFFIELDRATMSVARLAAKVLLYGQYYDYIAGRTDQPAWHSQYPRFPRLLVVLTGRDVASLNRRRDELAAYLSGAPHHRPEVRAGAT